MGRPILYSGVYTSTHWYTGVYTGLYKYVGVVEESLIDISDCSPVKVHYFVRVSLWIETQSGNGGHGSHDNIDPACCCIMVYSTYLQVFN